MTSPPDRPFASVFTGPARLVLLICQLARQVVRAVAPAAAMALLALGGCSENPGDPAELPLTVDLEASPFTLSWLGGPADMVEMWRCEQDCEERCVSGVEFTGYSTLRWRVDTSHLADPGAGITSPLTYGDPIGEYPEIFEPIESGRIYGISVYRGGPAADENRDADAVGCVTFVAP